MDDIILKIFNCHYVNKLILFFWQKLILISRSSQNYYIVWQNRKLFGPHKLLLWLFWAFGLNEMNGCDLVSN
jgi:hypothetical protein